MSTPSPWKWNAASSSSRQRHLGGRDGAVEREAEIAFDDIDECLKRPGIERNPRELAKLLQIAASLHQRELVPAREIRVVVVGNRQDLVHRTIAAALAETRRHYPVDDAIIEGVASDPDARMSERLGLENTGLAREAHHRKVAGPAAEIRHQHRGIVIELPREEERGADRLVYVARMPGSELRERRAVALHGELIVGVVPCELHWASDHHIAHRKIDLRTAMANKRAQKSREQVLEPVALTKDAGFLKSRACGESLEGLDEPMRAQAVEKMLDGPGSAFHMGAPPIAMTFVPEAHGGDIDLQRLAAMVERDSLDTTVRIGNGHDRVARPEIDADGEVAGRGWTWGARGGRAGPDGLYGQSRTPSEITCRRGTLPDGLPR